MFGIHYPVFKIRLGDDESMSGGHETVVLHGFTFLCHYRKPCLKLIFT